MAEYLIPDKLGRLGEIRLRRGDTLPPKGFVMNVDPDEIYFSVKPSSSDKRCLIQKRLSDGSLPRKGDVFYIVLLPTDTDKLPYGEYVCDIEVVWKGGLKKTFYGKLRICDEVTFAQNEV